MNQETHLTALAVLAEESGAQDYRLHPERAVEGWAIRSGSQIWLWASGLRPLQPNESGVPGTYQAWATLANGETVGLGSVGTGAGGTVLVTLGLPKGGDVTALLLTAQPAGSDRPTAVVLTGRMQVGQPQISGPGTPEQQAPDPDTHGSHEEPASAAASDVGAGVGSAALPLGGGESNPVAPVDEQSPGDAAARSVAPGDGQADATAFTHANQAILPNEKPPIGQATISGIAPPANDAPTASAPPANTPANDTPTANAPPANASAQGTPTASAPPANTLANDTPTANAPPANASAQGTPTESAPPASTSTDNAPTGSGPTTGAPAGGTLTESGPVASAPAEGTPMGTVPADEAPAAATPPAQGSANNTPAAAAPPAQGSANNTPTAATPPANTSANDTPKDSAPPANAPAASSPTDDAQGGHPPAAGTPAGAPAGKAPVNKTPASQERQSRRQPAPGPRAEQNAEQAAVTAAESELPTPPPGCSAVDQATVQLQPQAQAAAGATGAAQLNFVKGGLLLTLRGLPRPEQLGEAAQTGRPYNAYRAWLQSSANGKVHALGVAARVWTDTYRVQVRGGLPLRRYDTLLVTVEDRAGSGARPSGPLLLNGRYRWYQPRS